MYKTLGVVPKWPVPQYELIRYLRETNLYETKLAQQALREKIASPVRDVLLSGFKFAPPELDNLALKKIINALLTAGEVGKNRLINVLSTINFSSSLALEKRDYVDVANTLRTKFSDARKTKIMLDNQCRCVNAVIKFAGSSSSKIDKGHSIRSRSDLQNWTEDIYQKWGDHSKLKDANLYRNIFSIFMATFDENLENSQYQLVLEEKIENYLNPNYEGYLEALLDEPPTNTFESKSDDVHIEMKMVAGELFFYIFHPIDNKNAIKQIKSDLLWKLGSTDALKKLSFAVSSIESDVPVICVRLNSPKNKREFDILNETIHNFFNVQVPTETAGSRLEKFTPKEFSDATKIGKFFMEGNDLLVDLSEMDDQERKRFIDFISGLVFSSSGRIDRVSAGIFKITHDANRSLNIKKDKHVQNMQQSLNKKVAG